MGRTKVRLLKGSLARYWKTFLGGAEDVGPGPLAWRDWSLVLSGLELETHFPTDFLKLCACSCISGTRGDLLKMVPSSQIHRPRRTSCLMHVVFISLKFPLPGISPLPS